MAHLQSTGQFPRRKPLKSTGWYDPGPDLDQRFTPAEVAAEGVPDYMFKSQLGPDNNNTMSLHPLDGHQSASFQLSFQNSQPLHNGPVHQPGSPPATICAGSDVTPTSYSGVTTNSKPSSASTPPQQVWSSSAGPATANTHSTNYNSTYSSFPPSSRPVLPAINPSWADDSSFPTQAFTYPSLSQLTKPASTSTSISTSTSKSRSTSSPTSHNPSFSSQTEVPTASMITSISRGQVHSRRTVSNATTTSTTSSGTYPGLPPSPLVVLSNLKRAESNSSRSTSGSGSTPSSYVSIMRKQKATVWCDRSQSVDPHLFAKQRVARDRVAREMVGPRFDHNAFASYAAAHPQTSALAGRDVHERPLSTITTSSRQKVKPHASAPQSIPSDMSGAKIAAISVPQRLSSSEVYDDEKDNSLLCARTNSSTAGRANSMVAASAHSRSGSGRSSSSIGSGGHQPGARSSFISLSNFSAADKSNGEGRDSTGSESLRKRTTSMSEMRDPSSLSPEYSRTPAWSNYLSPPTSVRSSPAPQRKASSGTQKSNPLASPISEEEYHSPVPVPELPPNFLDFPFFSHDGDEEEEEGNNGRGLTLHNPDIQPSPRLRDPSPSIYSGGPWGGNKSNTTLTPLISDELRRRGSVDDRSMTMTGSVRLYVANPDVSD